MRRIRSLVVATVVSAASLVTFGATAHAHHPGTAQLCTLGSAAVGQPATIICKNVLSGATTQTVALGRTISAAGAVGGNFSRHGDRVLVTNQAGGAVLLREDDGLLGSPVTLSTGAEGSLSGALTRKGAYVVTGTRIVYFPSGSNVAASSQKLLMGDGSASQVALAGGYAYVAEKSGSLEAFLLGKDGNLIAAATPVTGIPAGTIVGITAHDDLVVSTVAHFANNFNQAAISVVSGTAQVQLVPTKELAACWAANDHGQVCVANPGSMTVSCGRLGEGGFKSYTGAAANAGGDSVFDLDMRGDLVGIQATRAGSPVLQTYARSDEDSDFLTLTSEFPVGTVRATGALLLPGLSK